MTRVAVLDDYTSSALTSADWSAVHARGEVTVFTSPIRGNHQLATMLAPFDIIVTMRERTRICAELLDLLPNLRLLVTTGTRNAAIDVTAASSHGVQVVGTREVISPTVEHTWALILALHRHLVTEANAIQQGRWQTAIGEDLSCKTLGVVGFGRVGSRVARVAAAFDMRVLATSPHLTTAGAAEAGVESVALDDLLAGSDVVSLHVALTPDTRHLIGRRELDLIRPGAVLINTSRGPIVDTDALIDALDAGRVTAAGLDVFDEEPLPAASALRGRDDCLLTPHLGYVTRRTYELLYSDIVENILAYLDGTTLRPLAS